jgi:DNA-binding TFAR19-related protein (PDSD5 family)
MDLFYIVGRIQMVKADKARAVEDLLIRMAQSNQLRSKITEKQLIDLLGQINQQDSSSTQTRIVVCACVFFFLEKSRMTITQC